MEDAEQGLTSHLKLPPGDFLIQAAGSPEPKVFLRAGRLAMERLRGTLARHRVELHGSVLDFGCGCGLVLRHWNEPSVSPHGCDHRADMALWCREHLQVAQIKLNHLHPPASFRDGKFDLIYALEALSHLPEQAQGPWMRDFFRMLKPGGHLVISTNGRSCLERLSRFDQKQFLGGQIVVQGAVAAGSALCSAFHPPAYVRGQMTQGFEVIAHEPDTNTDNPGKDLWLLRRQPG